MTGKGVNTKNNKRKDKNRIVLRTGEGQRPNGTYEYRWTDEEHKRRRVYAKTLEELREKEEEILKDRNHGIKAEARYKTLNELFDVWKQLKRGLKDNTFQNYQYVYNMFVRPGFGKNRISEIKKSDVKRFYNLLADERCLKVSTIDSVHTVLHQVLDMAVDDDYLRANPSNNVLKELKQSHVFKTEKRKALTRSEQELLLNYLQNSDLYKHWYPIIAVMVGTGLRVGEVTGLRWCDIDLDGGMIDVNHTLVYYNHRETEGKKGCYFTINTPKTEAGNRQVPMLDFVKEAFLMERKFQEENHIHCETIIDGYTDFIFVNRFGKAQHQGTLNKAIRRIIRDCNDKVLVRRILKNLIDNAIKYGCAGKFLGISLYERSGYSCIAVEDHGAGITEKDKEHIFTRAYTADRKKGNGLGLAISQGLASSMGGSISVSSIPREKTVFTVRLQS